VKERERGREGGRERESLMNDRGREGGRERESLMNDRAQRHKGEEKVKVDFLISRFSNFVIAGIVLFLNFFGGPLLGFELELTE
jgi:hypothetical protein